MQEDRPSRTHAVDRLQSARAERTRRSEQQDAATGSAQELEAATELNAADEQFAAREAWLKWIDRDY